VTAAEWAQAVTPAEIARQRAAGWPDFHPEDFCHQCGRRNPNWHADTETWQTATGSSGDGGGILCPSCFAALWERVTGKTAIIWRLSLDPRSRDLQ
jgi:hypothetical protein